MPSLAAIFLFVLTFIYASSGADSSISSSIMRGDDLYDQVVLEFGPEGGVDPSLSIPVPGGGPVISSSFLISTVEGKPAPESVSIDVGMDGRLEWSFGGGRFGAFGCQNSFSGEEKVKRVLQDSGGGLLSFLLPFDARVDNSSLVISTPPVPGPGRDSTVFDLPENVGIESIDSGDVDGDGEEEVVFHSEKDSCVYLLDEDESGNPNVTKVLNGIPPRPVIRIVTPSNSPVRGFVMQYRDRTEGTDNVSFMKFLGSGGMEEIHLSDGLLAGSVGFTVGSDSLSGQGNLYVLADNNGKVLEYHFNMNGALSVQVVLDTFAPTIGIGGGDLDGNGHWDLVMFPLHSNESTSLVMGGPNGTVVKVPKDESIYEFSPSGPGAVLDIDGDGKDELFFPMEEGNGTAAVGMEEDSPFISLFGPNTSSCSPRTLPREQYGDGGVYEGGEGFLYILTPKGDYHALPVSKPSGDYLLHKLPGLGGPSIIASHDMGASFRFCEFGYSGSRYHDLSWSIPHHIELNVRDSRMSMERSDPDPSIWDIGPLMFDYQKGNRTYDDFGNAMVQVEIGTGGDAGILSFSRLSIDYDVTFDAGMLNGFLEAQMRAGRDFGGETIPFAVFASSEGSVRIGPSVLIHDSPPYFLPATPRRIEVDEGSLGQTILKITDILADDMDDPKNLEVNIIPISDIPPGLLLIGRNNELISHASKYPDLFGEFLFRISANDGSSNAISAPITLAVRPVEDPPSINNPLKDITVGEGTPVRIPLEGSNGTFIDVDGDPLDFEASLTYSEPAGMEDFIRMEISEGELEIYPMIEGRGGRARLEITAHDGHGEGYSSATAVCMLTVINTDAPPMLLSNPGLVVLSEDQDTPARIPLNGWIYDPDTEIRNFEITAYSSDPRLLVEVSNDGRDPFLFLLPTSDLNGKATVWIEVSGGDITLVDRLMVEIEPQNDLPHVFIDEVRFQDGMGYVVSGHVTDPDDRGGSVEYRLGDGEWITAWGFESWSFLVEGSSVPSTGLYVFVRADDGWDLSAVEFTKIIPSYEPPEQPVIDEPGGGRTDPGNSEDPYSQPIPADPGGDGPSWMIAGGMGAVIIGGLLFILWTEVGYVTITTSLITIYSKLSKKDILNHEIRGLIRGYIIANPGDHYSSIKRNLDLNNGTLAYHLRVLEQNGFIKSMYDGIYKRYYPANINISRLKKNISKQEEIFNIILDHPGVTMEQIGRLIGVSRQVVNYHVKNLIRAGVITYSRDGKSARFYPAEQTSSMDQT